MRPLSPCLVSGCCESSSRSRIHRSYLELGNHEAAIRDFESVVFQKTNSSKGAGWVALYARPVSRLTCDAAAAAAEANTQADERRLRHLQYACNNLGFAYSCVGDHVRALGVLNKSIQLNPNDASAYSNRAAVLFDSGLYAGSSSLVCP